MKRTEPIPSWISDSALPLDKLISPQNEQHRGSIEPKISLQAIIYLPMGSEQKEEEGPFQEKDLGGL